MYLSVITLNTNRLNSAIKRGQMSKWLQLPKAIYKFSATPVKLPMPFSTELEQLIKKFAWKHKRPQRAKTALGENRNGGIMFPEFRLHYKSTVITTVWY